MHDYIVNYDIEWIDGGSNSYVYEYASSEPSERGVRNEILVGIYKRMKLADHKIPFRISNRAVIDLAQVKMINVDVRASEK